MGQAWRATDLELDRHVCVKLMSGVLEGDEDAVKRFRAEARRSALSNDHIVRIYDTGVDAAGHPYIVMELVRGKSLSECIRAQGRFAPEDATAIALQVLEALEAAHERVDGSGRPAGIIHRDLKPSNIMVEQTKGRYEAKLLDFGIARELSETATRLTHSGNVPGSVGYVAPEMFGPDAHPSPQLDV